MIEDGVLGVREGSSAPAAVKAALASGRVYALAPDLAARGMKPDHLIDGVQTVGCGGFVDLVQPEASSRPNSHERSSELASDKLYYTPFTPEPENPSD
jgi:sulfur relay protein TusB/DsrH